MRLYDALRNIFLLVFPWQESAQANVSIKRKIELLSSGESPPDLDYMQDHSHLSVSEIEAYFNKTLEARKSIEEKLKTSLFSITTGTAIVGLSITFLSSKDSQLIETPLLASIATTAFLSIFYLFFSAIFSLKAIYEIMQVYQLFPRDSKGIGPGELKERIAICTVLNSFSNTIKQNLMSTSFACTINAFALIMLLFVLIISSALIRKPFATPEIAEQKNIKPTYNFDFSSLKIDKKRE